MAGIYANGPAALRCYECNNRGTMFPTKAPDGLRFYCRSCAEQNDMEVSQ